ncbi:MAG: PAS domain S-box protein [Chlorobiaceae bacterium]|nr:PAS domain S-box protein [Chlorobiaceae bacterium]NTV60828.1 PAS domain S-box protein [Chlorobiaceae bacterium]
MSSSEEKATVLVVDDSDIIRLSTSRIVEKLGYHSIVAPDGESCLEILDSRHVDILLLDIHMPKKNGLEVLAYLREHQFTLPVIMISGSSDIEQALESLKKGAYEFLLKPVEPDRLAITIKNALSEQGLREQVKLLSAAMTQSLFSVIITDPDGIIEYVNPAFIAVSGYSETEVKGKKTNIISSGQHSRKFYSKLWKTIASGRIWEGEFVNRRKNGELFWEYATISPVADQAGKISHYVSIRQDITERKREKEALAESERRFQELADLLPQPVFECDTTGLITYTNRLGFELFGYTKEELENGVSTLLLYAPEDRERIRRNIECRLKGVPFENHEYTGLKKDGTRFPILVYSANIFREGKPVGIRGIVLDITARRQIEEKLQQLNQTLEQRVEERTSELEKTHRQMILQEKLASIGQLAAGLAHELNNPINFVRMNFASLKDDIDDLQDILASYREFIGKMSERMEPSDELLALRQKEDDLAVDSLLADIPEIFSESKNGFDRITTIIESMRNFSFRHAENRKVSFDVNKGIRDTMVIARNEYRYVAEIETSLEALPPVPCNPEQLNQVFLNLIINSAHAIASQKRSTKGKIVIHTWYDEREVFCSIADDGPGISPEVMRHVFEPFFTTKDPGKGTGLGLSISYDIIVQKHQGSLDVHSPPEGGTVFTIGLPLNKPRKTDERAQ